MHHSLLISLCLPSDQFCGNILYMILHAAAAIAKRQLIVSEEYNNGGEEEASHWCLLAVPVSQRDNFGNLNSNSAFKHTIYGAKSKVTANLLPTGNGILGKGPAPSSGPSFCSRCLGRDHLRPNCPNSIRCKAYLCFGHSFENCNAPPRSTRPSWHSGDHRQLKPMSPGPSPPFTHRFSSFREFLSFSTGLQPPSRRHSLESDVATSST